MTINEYLANLSPQQLAEYKRIDSVVHDLVSEAEVTISYGIPTWKYKGQYVLYFAAYKSHMSIYPASMDLLDKLKDELGDFEITPETKDSAGTVQFSEENPVPEVLVRAVVEERLQAINQK